MKTIKFLLISTLAGSHYRVYESGDIQRLDIEHKPSGQWKLTSLDKRNGSMFLRLPQLFAKAQEKAFVEFKSHVKQPGQIYLVNANKTGRYFVRDNDHGTVRQWSDAVKSIQYGEEEAPDAED